MSDYFTHLAARALGVSRMARPRRSIFEPRRSIVEPLSAEAEDVRQEPAAPEELEKTPRASRASARATPREVAEEPSPDGERLATRQAARRMAPRRPRAAERTFPPRPQTSPPPLEAAEPPEPAPPGRGAARSGAVRAGGTGEVQAEPAALPLTVRPPRLLASSKEARPPTVRVTIGRVEVRAATPEQPRPEQKRAPKRQPRMSLDEYLGRGP